MRQSGSFTEAGIVSGTSWMAGMDHKKIKLHAKYSISTQFSIHTKDSQCFYLQGYKNAQLRLDKMIKDNHEINFYSYKLIS